MKYTVKQLIEELQKYPQDCEFEICDWDEAEIKKFAQVIIHKNDNKVTFYFKKEKEQA